MIPVVEVETVTLDEDDVSPVVFNPDSSFEVSARFVCVDLDAIAKVLGLMKWQATMIKHPRKKNRGLRRRRKPGFSLSEKDRSMKGIM